jgi:hypothetical protein
MRQLSEGGQHTLAVGELGMATERQQNLMHQTRFENDALLEAMHALESALAAAAPTREQQWNERVTISLRPVRETLTRHVASAEEPGGLFEEIDVTRPTLARRVEQLRRDHAELLSQAAALQRMVEGYGPDEAPGYHDIRDRAASLLGALRRHQAAETDLVFESFYTDIGAAD